MKKIIIIIFVLLLAVLSSAGDIAGQDNVTLLSELINQFYIETFGGFCSLPSAFADTTTVEYLLNSSLLDVSTDQYCVERDTSIYTTADTFWYDLPSDLYDVPAGLSNFGVTSTGSASGIERSISLIAVDQIGLKGQIAVANEIPARYCIRKNQIYIEPVNNDSDVVKIYYAAYANNLDTLTDTTNVDKQYIRYAILKSAEKFLRTRNWGNYQSFATERLGLVRDNIVREETRLGITRKSLMEKTVQ